MISELYTRWWAHRAIISPSVYKTMRINWEYRQDVHPILTRSTMLEF